MIDGNFVRDLASLPAEVVDSKLAPHIKRAQKDVEKETGTLAADFNDFENDAAGCFAMYYAVPVLNTFYLEGADKVARQTGEMDDFVFSNPDDVEKIQAYWEKRAKTALKNSVEKQANEFTCEVI